MSRWAIIYIIPILFGELWIKRRCGNGNDGRDAVSDMARLLGLRSAAVFANVERAFQPCRAVVGAIDAGRPRVFRVHGEKAGSDGGLSFWNCLYLNSGLKVQVRYERTGDGGVAFHYRAYRSPTPAEFEESRAVMAEIVRWCGLELQNPPAADPPIEAKE